MTRQVSEGKDTEEETYTERVGAYDDGLKLARDKFLKSGTW